MVLEGSVHRHFVWGVPDKAEHYCGKYMVEQNFSPHGSWDEKRERKGPGTNYILQKPTL
jgi:hypothetical protein